jgi:glycogen debranching enzyme
MGTALGCPARRYHGLLVAAARPPVERIVALNQMFEQLWLHPAGEAGNACDAGQVNKTPQTLELSTCQFRDRDGNRLFAPQGYAYLERFERGLGVQWQYRWGAIRCSRTLLLHHRQQAATLRYRVTGLDEANATASLRLAPMVTLRDFHSLRHLGDPGEFDIQAGEDRCTVARDSHAVTFHCSGSTFTAQPDWWYAVHYRRETERGQGDQEDLFVPGVFECPAADAVDITLTVNLAAEPAAPIADASDRAKHLAPIRQALDGEMLASATQAASGDNGNSKGNKKASAGSTAPSVSATADKDTLADALTIAADDFIVERTLKGKTLSTIIAGYPWFADWGRDTFIALPGLLLTTGRHDEARDVLRVFAEAIDGGLVPNRFDDYTEVAAHYNTVDASLWFVHAALQYVEATGDTKSWRDWLAEACMQIVEAYAEGTGGADPAVNPLIAMRDDGLIAAGTRRTQLTWMDAACADVVFTPRQGKAVEINALWHNALAGLAERLPEAASGPAERYRKLANRVKRHFADVFWSDAAGYLFDHVVSDEAGEPRPDPSLRPNQLLACALPRSPLGRAKQKQVVEAVRHHLLTPAGLRTLPVDDPNYHGRYGGDQYQRDEAYHQGTIWPWLVGPYGEAVLRAHQFSAAARAHVRAAIRPLLASMVDGEAAGSLKPGSVGQLAEIYEANPDAAGRFHPVGCIAQAWSVAELLRLSDLLAHPPASG